MHRSISRQEWRPPVTIHRNARPAAQGWVLGCAQSPRPPIKTAHDVTGSTSSTRRCIRPAAPCASGVSRLPVRGSRPRSRSCVTRRKPRGMPATRGRWSRPRWIEYVWGRRRRRSIGVRPRWASAA